MFIFHTIRLLSHILCIINPVFYDSVDFIRFLFLLDIL